MQAKTKILASCGLCRLLYWSVGSISSQSVPRTCSSNISFAGKPSRFRRPGVLGASGFCDLFVIQLCTSWNPPQSESSPAPAAPWPIKNKTYSIFFLNVKLEASFLSTVPSLWVSLDKRWINLMQFNQQVLTGFIVDFCSLCAQCCISRFTPELHCILNYFITVRFRLSQFCWWFSHVSYDQSRDVSLESKHPEWENSDRNPSPAAICVCVCLCVWASSSSLLCWQKSWCLPPPAVCRHRGFGNVTSFFPSKLWLLSNHGSIPSLSEVL